MTHETCKRPRIARCSEGVRAGAVYRFVYHGFSRLAQAPITSVSDYADDYSVVPENVDVLAQRAPIRKELAGHARADDGDWAVFRGILFSQGAAGEERYTHGLEKTGANLIDTETLCSDGGTA